MSHTTKVEFDGSELGPEEGEIDVIHNGDWSGPLQVIIPQEWTFHDAENGTTLIKFPFGVVERIAAEHVRHEAEAKLEQVPWTELLGLRGY